MLCISRFVSFILGLASVGKTVEKAINSEVTLIRETAQQLNLDFKGSGTTPGVDSTSREGSPELLRMQERAAKAQCPGCPTGIQEH
jgi:hypothetical protein